jgi:hypothetical protein
MIGNHNRSKRRSVIYQQVVQPAVLALRDHNLIGLLAMRLLLAASQRICWP